MIHNIKNLKKDVKIYSSYFIVGDELAKYEDILSLKWYWISRTINGINFQEQELTLFDKNGSDIVGLHSRKYFLTPPLVELYKYIAEKTYLNRLKRYTREIDEKGFFYMETISMDTLNSIQMQQLKETMTSCFP